MLIDGAAPGDGEDGEHALAWWPLAVTAGRADGAARVRVDATATPAQRFSVPEGLRDDDAMIMFTGGTTGVPNGPVDRGNIAGSVRAIVAGYQLGPGTPRSR